MLFIASNEWLMCVGGGVSSELDTILSSPPDDGRRGGELSRRNPVRPFLPLRRAVAEFLSMCYNLCMGPLRAP